MLDLIDRAVADVWEHRRNSIWIYDCTHFAGCPKIAVFAVTDLVTRKWICGLVSIGETSTQVQVVFLDALEAEGLIELVEARQDPVPADTFPSLPTLTCSRRCCSPSATTGRR